MPVRANPPVMRLLITLAALLLLPACITVDESRVFRAERVTADRPELSIRMGDGWLKNGPTFTHAMTTLDGRTIATTVADGDAVTLNMTVNDKQIEKWDLAPDRRPVILYCGGAQWDRVNHGFAQLMFLTVMGDPVLWDYPGYGDSPGTPSIEGLRDLASHIAAWADGLAGERPLVLWGHSLGGAVCVEVASHSSAADLLVLEASFDRGGDAVRGVVKNFIPVPLRVDVDDAVAAIDTGTAAAALDMSMLVLVAARDEVIPPDQQRALAAKIGAGEREGRTVVEVPTRHDTTMLHPNTLRAVRAEFERLGWLAVPES